ncbi:mucin-13 [Grus japonensis]|uniref:Mucin-13 n=1 Tax=Grus japonensis TaxID=30415 RepID=A0ABC9X1D3_GRUJA
MWKSIWSNGRKTLLAVVAGSRITQAFEVREMTPLPEKEELETTVGHPISNGLKQCILLEHKAEQTHCSAKELGQEAPVKIRLPYLRRQAQQRQEAPVKHRLPYLRRQAQQRQEAPVKHRLPYLRRQAQQRQEAPVKHRLPYLRRQAQQRQEAPVKHRLPYLRRQAQQRQEAPVKHRLPYLRRQAQQRQEAPVKHRLPYLRRQAQQRQFKDALSSLGGFEQTVIVEIHCPVGYSGENCKNNSKLILIIVGTVFGAIILSLVIAVSIVSVRAKHKQDPEKKSLIRSGYSNPNTSDNRQTTMFPRVQTTSGHANPGYQPNNPYEMRSSNRGRFPERDYDDLLTPVPVAAITWLQSTCVGRCL